MNPFRKAVEPRDGSAIESLLAHDVVSTSPAEAVEVAAN